MSDCESESILSVDSSTKTRKKGIVYLSSIPKYMNVTKLRELLGQYGEIGRVFLQPAANRNILLFINFYMVIYFNQLFILFQRI